MALSRHEAAKKYKNDIFMGLYDINVNSCPVMEDFEAKNYLLFPVIMDLDLFGMPFVMEILNWVIALCRV